MTYVFAIQNKEELYLMKALDKGTYESFLKLSFNLVEISEIENLLKIAQLNHSELKSIFGKYNESEEKELTFFSRYQSIELNVNRLLINLLSSIRMYLDHTETRLNRTHDSKELGLFKESTSVAFDSSFAYRFLSHFRNFFQHCGLAKEIINIKTDYIEGVATREVITIILSRDKLLNAYDWKKLRPELKKMPESFEILPLIEEKMRLLAAIDIRLNQNLYEKLVGDGLKFVDLLKTVSNYSGAPCFLEQKQTGTLVSYIPLELVKKIPKVDLTFFNKLDPPKNSELSKVNFHRIY